MCMLCCCGGSQTNASLTTAGQSAFCEQALTWLKSQLPNLVSTDKDNTLQVGADGLLTAIGGGHLTAGSTTDCTTVVKCVAEKLDTQTLRIDPKTGQFTVALMPDGGLSLGANGLVLDSVAVMGMVGTVPREVRAGDGLKAVPVDPNDKMSPVLFDVDLSLIGKAAVSLDVPPAGSLNLLTRDDNTGALSLTDKQVLDVITSRLDSSLVYDPVTDKIKALLDSTAAVTCLIDRLDAATFSVDTTTGKISVKSADASAVLAALVAKLDGRSFEVDPTTGIISVAPLDCTAVLKCLTAKLDITSFKIDPTSGVISVAAKAPELRGDNAITVATADGVATVKVDHDNTLQVTDNKLGILIAPVDGQLLEMHTAGGLKVSADNVRKALFGGLAAPLAVDPDDGSKIILEVDPATLDVVDGRLTVIGGGVGEPGGGGMTCATVRECVSSVDDALSLVPRDQNDPERGTKLVLDPVAIRAAVQAEFDGLASQLEQLTNAVTGLTERLTAAEEANTDLSAKLAAAQAKLDQLRPLDPASSDLAVTVNGDGTMSLSLDHAKVLAAVGDAAKPLAAAAPLKIADDPNNTGGLLVSIDTTDKKWCESVMGCPWPDPTVTAVPTGQPREAEITITPPAP